MAQFYFLVLCRRAARSLQHSERSQSTPFAVPDLWEWEQEVLLLVFTCTVSERASRDRSRLHCAICMQFLYCKHVVYEVNRPSTGLWCAFTAVQVILRGEQVSQPFLWRRQIRLVRRTGQRLLRRLFPPAWRRGPLMSFSNALI